MLYEVITPGDEPVRHGVLGAHPVVAVGVLDDALERLPGLGGYQLVDAVAGLLYLARITSYNVCYTKLLRSVDSVTRAPEGVRRMSRGIPAVESLSPVSSV